MDEETPRPNKRHAGGIATPSVSIEDKVNQGTTRTPSTASGSDRSGTSRGSSPSKRRREIELLHSVPVAKFLTRSQSRAWKQENRERYPLLETLLDAFRAKPQRGTNPQAESIRGIVRKIGYCQMRRVNEDTWCDKVVYPFLQLAAELAGDEINVHNVKTIHVWPTVLLPTNAQHMSIPKKRIDYSLGYDVLGHAGWLTQVENNTISQAIDDMLADQALFSHLEAKTSRSPDDARFQLFTWCAAGFQKQKGLITQRMPDAIPRLAPVPVWQWQETNVQLYVAAIDVVKQELYILDEFTWRLSDDDEDVKEVEELLAVMVAIMQWGKNKYLPWYRGILGLAIPSLDTAATIVHDLR